MNDTNSLAHTSWNCKYHIVFAPKYRRKVFFWTKTERNRCNSARVVRMEKCRNNRSRNMS